MGESPICSVEEHRSFVFGKYPHLTPSPLVRDWQVHAGFIGVEASWRRVALAELRRVYDDEFKIGGRI